MWSDVKEVATLVGTTAIVIVLALWMFLLPLMWLEGRVKARLIREQQGIDLPWYDAVFFPMDDALPDSHERRGEADHGGTEKEGA